MKDLEKAGLIPLEKESAKEVNGGRNTENPFIVCCWGIGSGIDKIMDILQSW